jgi:hypothetical protein
MAPTLFSQKHHHHLRGAIVPPETTNVPTTTWLELFKLYIHPRSREVEFLQPSGRSRFLSNFVHNLDSTPTTNQTRISVSRLLSKVAQFLPHMDAKKLISLRKVSLEEQNMEPTFSVNYPSTPVSRLPRRVGPPYTPSPSEFQSRNPYLVRDLSLAILTKPLSPH